MQLHDIYLSVYFNKPSMDISNKRMREICEYFIGARVNPSGIIVHSRYYRYKGTIKIVLRCFTQDNSKFNVMDMNLRFYNSDIKVSRSDITNVISKKISPKVKISTMNI